MKHALTGLLGAVLLTVSVVSRGEPISERGVIDLKVVDSQGAPLPGVTVILSRSEVREGTEPVVELTGRSGEVTFAKLSQGTYSVRCELSGFFTTTLSGVPVELTKPSPRLPNPITVVLPAGPIRF